MSQSTTRSSDAKVLRISETHLFGSTADRTYVGQEGADGQMETVLVPVPADAVGFALGEGIAEDRFLSASEGLVDTEPVRPGTLMSEVRFSYHEMVGDDPISLVRPFAYPVVNLTVLAAQPGLSLNSPQLYAWQPFQSSGPPGNPIDFITPLGRQSPPATQ